MPMNTFAVWVPGIACEIIAEVTPIPWVQNEWLQAGAVGMMGIALLYTLWDRKSERKDLREERTAWLSQVTESSRMRREDAVMLTTAVEKLMENCAAVQARQQQRELHAAKGGEC